MFEDKLLDVFTPHLKRLVQDKQEQSQRCAAEILSGIIRGSKHWNFKSTEYLWNEILPIMKLGFSNMYEETISDWVACVGMALDGRDPRSIHWFLEFLIDDPLSEQSSIIGCGRLLILQQALIQQPWRNPEMTHRLLNYLKNHLYHPFQNVREKIGIALASAFSKDIQFNGGLPTDYPRVKDFFEKISANLNDLYKLVLDKIGHSDELSNKVINKDGINNGNQLSKGLDNGFRHSILLFEVGKFIYNLLWWIVLD